MILIFFVLIFICFTLRADSVVTINNSYPTDCLYNMAKSHYGNPSLWPALKDYNTIADEKKIPNGAKIKIPSKNVAQQLMNATTAAEKQAIIASANSGTPTPPATPPTNPGGTGGSGNYTQPKVYPNPKSPPYNIDNAFGSKKVD